MPLPQYRYPLDKTGVSPDNYVANELHSLNPQANVENARVFAPIYGPFFSESVVIKDRADNRTLVKDTDYKITDLLQDASLKFGKAVGQFIVVINGLVSNEISINYQVLGGNYQNDSTAIQHVFETFLNDTRPVDWNSVTGKPLTYPTNLHLHLLEDVIGFGPVIVALEQIKEAILLGSSPVIQSLIDWVETRDTPWENIVGADANIVTIDRRINTPEEGGIFGGGALSSDLTLSLRTLFPAESTYGSPSSVPVFDIDIYGRVKGATQVNIEIDWTQINGKPSNLAGYGISDAVDVTGEQVVTGIKTFTASKFTKGSTAENFHNPDYSNVVTVDYLTEVINSLPTAQTTDGVTNRLTRYFFSQL